MDDFQMAWPFMIPIVGTICTFVYVIVLTLSRARVRELEVRERIAMIERGLVPPPEVDPRGFDREMDRHARRYDRRYARFSSRSVRHRRSGVTVMGIGLGLMVLIAFAGGDPNVAVGVGGAILVLGVAFFINGMLDTSEEPPAPFGQRYATPSTPPGAPMPPVTAAPPSDHRVD